MLPEAVTQYLERHARSLLTALVGALLVVSFVSDFFPPLQSILAAYNIYTIIIVALVAYTFAEVVELRRDYEGFRPHVFAHQREAQQDWQHFIDHNRIVKADLLEYSTKTIGDLLDHLKESGSQIRLLMKNPNTEAADYQRMKIPSDAGAVVP